MAEFSGAQLTVMQLQREGVDTLYCLRGDPSHPICDYAARVGMRVICVAHEQSAVMAASAHSYLTRTCGVAVVGSGPAHTNALTGIANAWANCWPVLLIAGSAESNRRHMGDFQEAPQVESASSFCKFSYSADSEARIPVLINTAIRKALSGRPGPVYLDLPSDFITDLVSEEDVFFPEPFGSPSQPQADPVAVTEALKVLEKAERPLMIVGKGAAWSRAEEELTRFIQRTNIPFLTTPMGAGSVSPELMTSVASARTQALKEADTIFLVGARLNWILHFGMPPRFSEGFKLIHLDISPEELGTNVPATVGLVGDAKAVIAQLNAELDKVPVHYSTESTWLMSLKETCTKNAAAIEPMLNSDFVPMGYYRILKEIEDSLPRDAIVVADGANVMDISRQVVQTSLPRHRLDAGVYGNVGVGFPFSMAAHLTNPDKKVLVLQGDWSLGFNGMEMETVARYKMPIVYVVFQNGNTESWHRDYILNQEQPKGYIPALRYDLMMQALGGEGETVENPTALRQALERGLTKSGPYLINVIMDPTASRRPQEFFWLARQGSMRY